MRPDRSAIEESLIIGTLFFMPFAFGGVYTWAWCVMALVSAVLFSAHFVSSPGGHGSLKGHPLFMALSLPASVAMLLFLAVSLLYIVPLPEHVIRFLSPGVYRLRESYAPDPASWQTLSVYPRATISSLIKLTAYAMLFLVIVSKIAYPRYSPVRGPDPAGDGHDAAAPPGPVSEGQAPPGPPEEKTELFPKPRPARAGGIPRSIYPSFVMFGALCGVLSILFHGFADFNLRIPSNALYFVVLLAVITALSARPVISLDCVFIEKLAGAIVITGFSAALFGIIQCFSWTGSMYWLVRKPGNNFGPFISYNNFAGFMQLTSFMSISLFYAGIFTSPLRHMRRLKDRIVWLSSPDANKTLLYLFMSVVMAGALFLSSSRAGIVSFVLTLAVFTVTCVAIGARSRKAKILIISALVISLFAAMAVWLGPEGTLNRFSRLRILWDALEAREYSRLLLRIYIWEDTLKVIRDLPLTGAGPGTYSDIFVLYRTFPAAWGFLRHAHQDYLQLLAETGAAGALLMLFFFVWYLRKFTECLKRLGSGARRLEGRVPPVIPGTPGNTRKERRRRRTK